MHVCIYIDISTCLAAYSKALFPLKFTKLKFNFIFLLFTSERNSRSNLSGPVLQININTDLLSYISSFRSKTYYALIYNLLEALTTLRIV